MRFLEWLCKHSSGEATKPPEVNSLGPIGRAWPAIVFLWIALAACAGSPKPAVDSTPPAPPPAAEQSLPLTPSAPVQPPSTLPPIYFTIQVGAFSTPERAAQETDRLQNAGLDAYYYQDDDNLYKVRFESFDTWDAARERALDLQFARLIDSFFIVRPTQTVVGDTGAFLRENLIQTVHRFIGMPYRWGGASQDDGFDCSGLTMTVYRLNGLDLPRSARGQYGAGRPVAIESLEPGDLVFFATGRGSHITHVGIYSGRNHFIHAPGKGKSIQSASLSGDYFKKRFVGARRYF